MKIVLNRFSVEKPETRPDAKLSRQVKSTNMMVKNSIISGSTVPVLWIMFQLVLSAAMQIASDNRKDLNK